MTKPKRRDTIDTSTIVIEDTPYGVVDNPYAPIFDKLKVGQCVRCNPDDINRVYWAMYKWVNASSYAETRMIRRKKKCDDGYARIWLLPKPHKMADLKGRKVINMGDD